MFRFIILILLIATNSFADIETYTPATGWKEEASADVVRPRTIILDKDTLTDNTSTDGSIRIYPASSDLLNARFINIDGDTPSGVHNYSSATFRLPNSITLPASCATGDTYMDTDATSGQRIYACQSANTWVLQGDGGAGGAPTDATYITQTANATLTAEQALSTLATGIMRVATTTGAITSLTDSAGIAANVSDETGTGALVFGTSPTFTTDITFPALSVEAGAYGAATIDGDDIAAGIAGRSLTLTAAAPDTLDLDAEAYSDTKCVWWENPVATDDFKSVWFAKQAATITSLWCESDQTVTAMFQVDDGTVADVDTVDLTCDSTPPEDTALDGDATLASGDRLDIDVFSVAGTPTWVSMCFTFSYDD